jgi:hypothetical protein
VLLKEYSGHLEVVDIDKNFEITSSHKLKVEKYSTNDLVAIDANNYMLAYVHGILKITKDQVI